MGSEDDLLDGLLEGSLDGLPDGLPDVVSLGDSIGLVMGDFEGSAVDFAIGELLGVLLRSVDGFCSTAVTYSEQHFLVKYLVLKMEHRTDSRLAKCSDRNSGWWRACFRRQEDGGEKGR